MNATFQKETKDENTVNAFNFSNVELVRNTEWRTVELNGEEVEIPVGWTVRKIGREINFTLGHTPQKINDNYNGLIDWVTISNLDNSGYVVQSTAKIKTTRTRVLPKGSLVGSFKMTVGKFCILGMDAVTNEAIVGASPDDAPNHNLQYLRFSLVDPFIKGATTNGQGVKLLNTKKIKSLDFVAPPLSQQTLIAKLLTAQEEHIENLRSRASIERKKLAFLSDELLSGRIRVSVDEGGPETVIKRDENGHVVETLPRVKLEVNTEWQTVELNGEEVEIPLEWEGRGLKSICSISSGQSPDGKDVFVGLPTNDLIDFHQGNADFGNKYTNLSQKVINKAKAPKICEKDTVLLSVRAPVGEINFSSNELCYGRGLCAIKTTICDNKFIYYQLKLNKSILNKNANGSTFMAVKKSDVEELQILLPELAEQIIIAKLLTTQEKHLSDLETLISFEEKRLAWLSDELLSGRILIKEKL